MLGNNVTLGRTRPTEGVKAHFGRFLKGFWLFNCARNHRKTPLKPKGFVRDMLQSRSSLRIKSHGSAWYPKWHLVTRLLGLPRPGGPVHHRHR